MAAYESDHTRFMRDWLAQHPQEAAEQKKGRALWWDQPQDVATQAKLRDATVPVKPYYYDTDH